jgi:hypothetical protein
LPRSESASNVLSRTASSRALLQRDRDATDLRGEPVSDDLLERVKCGHDVSRISSPSREMQLPARR